MQSVISLQQGVARAREWQLAAPASFELCPGEHIAIVGRNGSGKSLLVDMLLGRHPLQAGQLTYDFAPSRTTGASDNISYLAFRDTYGPVADRSYYLQQRWNQTEFEEDAHTVGQRLERLRSTLPAADAEYSQQLQALTSLFHLDELKDKNTILLSSGELRKLELIGALLRRPRVLIIDNPFIGLDADARREMTEALHSLTTNRALSVILIENEGDALPHFITHVVALKDKHVGPKVSRESYEALRTDSPESSLSPEKRDAILHLPCPDGDKELSEVVRLNHVSITYGRRTILRDVCWTINNGERWALSGPNGSGKSTLLSLICADNPQSYACDITLFDKPRGSGESIWDIKRHIGYVSPELHRAFRRDADVVDLVAAGRYNTAGQYARTTAEDRQAALFWMHVFGIDSLAGRRYLSLSSGEQRLVLLARAFVKDPDLLILDEPFHGLDASNIALAQDVITTFTRRPGKTLIMVSHFAEQYPPCIDRQKTLDKPSEE